MAAGEKTQDVSSKTVPWLHREFLPEKPVSDSLFGYIDSDEEEVSCTWEELQAAVEEYGSGIWYVWTPDYDKLVPPQEVPALNRYFQKKKCKLGYRHLFFGLAGLSVLGGYILRYGLKNDISPLLPLLLLTVLGLLPLIIGIRLIARFRKPATKTNQDDALEARFEYWLEDNQRPVGAFFLTGVLGVLFLVQYFTGMRAAIALGGILYAPVSSGEYHRLLSSVMVHADIFHITMNSLATLFIAKKLSALWSPYGAVLVFLVTGIAGALVSILLTPAANTVGASGAVCGLLGFLSVMVLSNSRDLPFSFKWSIYDVVFLLVCVGVIGFRFISNSVHAGGFVAGIIMALLLWNKKQIPGKTSKGVLFAGMFSAVILLVGGGYLAFRMVTN